MVVDVVVDVVTLFLDTSPPFYAPQGSDQDLCLLRCSLSYVFNSFILLANVNSIRSKPFIRISSLSQGQSLFEVQFEGGVSIPKFTYTDCSRLGEVHA